MNCPTVCFNDVESARQATLHLIDSGMRRIAFLGGPNRVKQAVDRKHGYLEALRERHVEIRKELVGTEIAGVTIADAETQRAFIRDNDVDIAILSINKDHAQQVADEVGMVISGSPVISAMHLAKSRIIPPPQPRMTSMPEVIP